MLMSPAKTDRKIKIHFTRDFRDISFSAEKFKKLIKTICTESGNDKIYSTAAAAARYEISVAIIDDRSFRKINQRFLKRKTISDCLSFDLSDYSAPGSLKIFELVINGQTALRQARLLGHSAEAELALYVTHGLLHQLGYDDTKPAEAKSMHQKEDEILNKSGFGMVYNKPT
jgi:probable rRNA maturation factor